MIESLVASLAVKGGAQLLRAAIEDRALGREDAASVVTALLDAIVSGHRKADEQLQRIEQKINANARDPYHAAMRAGGRALADAVPSHRRPEDRRQMLADARQAFAEAIGHAHDHPVDLARAEVMYGMTWLALGSPQDLSLALRRAIVLLQREVLVSFQHACRDNRDYERRQAATSTRVREAVLGPGMRMPDWTASDRFYVAQAEHDAVWQLRLLSEGSADPFPALARPHGSAYSHPTPGLPIRVSVGARVSLLGVELALSRTGVRVENRSGSTVTVALIEPVLNPEAVISPDVSALSHTPTYVSPATSIQVLHTGPGQPAACLGLGRADHVDVAALLHTNLDWTWKQRSVLRGFWR